jgi:amino acid permease
MIQLSPPSPEVRAIVKLMGIAAVVVIAQGVMLVLDHFFTVEDIMSGICACIIAVAVYMIYQVMVAQERHNDTLDRLNKGAK